MENPEKPLILSVDDDLDILKLIEKYLTENGFNVITYNMAAKALKSLEDIKPDLILVDVKMPEMNGYEFSSNLQNKNKFSSIPVVFLSALQREQDKAQAFASGAVDYLTKPINKEILINVIKKHLLKSKEWDAMHRKAEYAESQSSLPSFNKFREFLSIKLNLSLEVRNKISNIGVFKLYSMAPELGITTRHLARFIAENTGLPYVPFVNPEDIQLGVLPAPFCKKNFVIPAKDKQDQLAFIVSNPFNLELTDILGKQLPIEQQVKLIITHPDTIDSILKYSPEAPIKKVTFAKGKGETGLMKREEVKKLSKEALEDKPAVYISDNIIFFAISEGASDIHIEPKENDTIVRFRINGDLRNIYSLKKKTGNMIISRFKVLGELDITEKRKPQDGVVDAFIEGKNLRLRLATTVTLYGESLIIRLIETGSSPKSLDKLGMSSNQVKTMMDFANRSDGLVLIVGPIGSGKTTTIYSLLFKIDYQNRSLVSVEDPIEYEIPFANQQQINEKAGVSFETLLKSSVRQDPNILFIGEIRDKQSANIAMDFASTSHLTITSLHTANATTAIFRLERLEISRETVANTVIGIVAQRLLKKLCSHCKHITPISKEEAKMLSLYTDDIPSKLAHPVGCPKCNFSGFKGREGIFEIMKYDSEIIEMIRSDKTISKIREFMRARGDYLMTDHALDKLKRFVFSPNELYEKVLVEESRFEKKIPRKEDRQSIQTNEKSTIKISILVVEDDKDTQKLLSHLLQNKGYKVIPANDGIEALQLLAKQDFDLIISDVAMPNLDGFKLIELIHQKGITTPVIFLSALSKEEDEIKGLQLGAEDYIKKPIQKEILFFRVKKTLEKYGSKKDRD